MFALIKKLSICSKRAMFIKKIINKLPNHYVNVSVLIKFSQKTRSYLCCFLNYVLMLFP